MRISMILLLSLAQIVSCASSQEIAEYNLLKNPEGEAQSIGLWMNGTQYRATARPLQGYLTRYTGVVAKLPASSHGVYADRFRLSVRGEEVDPLMVRFHPSRDVEIDHPNAEEVEAVAVILVLLVFVVILFALMKEKPNHAHFPVGVQNTLPIRSTPVSRPEIVRTELSAGARGYVFLVFPNVDRLDENATLIYGDGPWHGGT